MLDLLLFFIQLMQLKLCDQDNFYKMTVLFEPQQIQKSSNIGAVRAPFSGWSVEIPNDLTV